MCKRKRFDVTDKGEGEKLSKMHKTKSEEKPFLADCYRKALKYIH